MQKKVKTKIGHRVRLGENEAEVRSGNDFDYAAKVRSTFSDDVQHRRAADNRKVPKGTFDREKFLPIPNLCANLMEQ